MQALLTHGPMCRKCLCFWLFFICRCIGQYISLELFYLSASPAVVHPFLGSLTEARDCYPKKSLKWNRRETEGKKVRSGWSPTQARDCYPREALRCNSRDRRQKTSMISARGKRLLPKEDSEMELQRDWRQTGTVWLISYTGKRLLPKRDSEKSSRDWRQKPQWALPEARDCYLTKAVKWNLGKTEGKRVRLGWSPTQARDRYPRETQRCNARDWRQKGEVGLISYTGMRSLPKRDSAMQW